MIKIKIIFLFCLLCVHSLYANNLSSINYKIYFGSSYYQFNNSDYKIFDENDIKNTDDRSEFYYSTIGVNFKLNYKNTSFYTEIYKSGFWGYDNLEGKDDNKNGINIKKLYVKFFLNPFYLNVGRQYLSLGSKNEYLFKDIIDGLVLSYNFNKKNHIKFLYDILSIASKPDASYLFANIKKDDENTKYFEGNTISSRLGLILNLEPFKIFGFYLKYGANSKGAADKAENGLNDLNKEDGDYLFLGGSRVGFEIFNDLFINFSFAYSLGKDYLFDKEKKYNDWASYLNIDFNFLEWSSVNISIAYFSKDFCGMKSESMGGVLLYEYNGFFSSNIAGQYHFMDSDDIAYESKTFIKSDLKFEIDTVNFILVNTFLWKSSGFEYIGNENELKIIFEGDPISFKFQFSIFKPGSYIKNKGWGDDLFYGIKLGLNYSFSNI